MHPLLITLTFLLLISTLVTGRVKEFISHSIVKQLYMDRLRMENQVAYERTLSTLDEIKDLENDEPKPRAPRSQKKQRERTMRSLGINLSRPPNNARLNFCYLDLDETFNLAARLLRRLYGQNHHFQRDGHLEYKLLKAIRQQETGSLRYAEDLATLTLGDSYLQEVLSFLLKGCLDAEGNPLPSFLDFISFDPDSKNLNFLFAPSELIALMIQNEKAVTQILELREFYWAVILDQEEHRKERKVSECLNRTEIKEEMKTKVQQILLTHGIKMDLHKLFDFSLGKEGNVLIVRDEITQLTRREKVKT